MEDKLTHLKSTKPSDLRVGDIISVSGYGVLRDRLTVTDKNPYSIRADHAPNDGALFTLSDSEWKFYLIERPKPQLPECEGARIVAWKIDGKERPEGVVLQHDGTVSVPWAGAETYHSADDIQEWAEIPTDYFDSLRNN